MQAESIASCANNSRVHPVTRSRGVSCRRCRAASACSSYLRATSTAVIHAHARGQTQRGVCGHAPQHNEDVPSVMRRGTKGSTCAWTQRERQWYGVLSSAARPGSSAAWQERTAEAALPCTQCVSRSAPTAWRAVPPYYNAILAQSMRAQHASNTTARANYHTRLPSFKRLAIAWSDMRLATQTMKPAVRGAHGTCLYHNV